MRNSKTGRYNRQNRDLGHTLQVRPHNIYQCSTNHRRNGVDRWKPQRETTDGERLVAIVRVHAHVKSGVLEDEVRDPAFQPHTPNVTLRGAVILKHSPKPIADTAYIPTICCRHEERDRPVHPFEDDPVAFAGEEAEAEHIDEGLERAGDYATDREQETGRVAFEEVADGDEGDVDEGDLGEYGEDELLGLWHHHAFWWAAGGFRDKHDAKFGESSMRI